MTPLQWFGLALLVALACGGAYLVGWSVSRQSAENLILAAERDGLVKGTAQGQLDGYRGGFTAGWRAAHRVALRELQVVPRSLGGRRIVKALAVSVQPEPPRIEWSWAADTNGETKHINVALQSEDADPVVVPATPDGAP